MSNNHNKLKTMKNEKNTRPGKDLELRVHDGIVAVIILLSVVLGMYVNPLWLWLAIATGVIMLSSSFTGFCPVHFILGKIMPPSNDES